MACKLQLSQKGKRRHQISTKYCLLCSHCMFTCKLPVAERGNTQPALHWMVVTVLCACLPVCVCLNPVRKGSKRPRAKNLSSVVSDFIHSRWREKERGGRWRKMVGTNPPSHGRTRLGCTSHRLTVIRTRDASYGPPAHLRPVNHSLINHP